MMYSRGLLLDGWTLALGSTPAAADPRVPAPVAAGTVEASVPGCVHTDLLTAGLIDDPYVDDNEYRLAWIGEQDWVYRTTFDARGCDEGAGERADLVFHGLDTIATVTLNGVDVARTANMHRTYRIRVGHLLREHGNELTVRLHSPAAYARQWREQVLTWPSVTGAAHPSLRKMACNYGWDWGPVLLTCGIWQSVELHTWTMAHLASVRPLTTVAQGDGLVEVHVEVGSAGRQDAPPLMVVAAVEGTDVVQRTQLDRDIDAAVVHLAVPSPQLWWPHGQGGQRLYELTVTLVTADGTELDSWRRRIGFRTVALDTTPDEHGTPYRLIVNDRPIFVRGVNWIPEDCFPSRLTRERVAQRLTQACEAGVNYVRVWGGGLYESEDFYELCDELGLLVGQDFLFACAAYAEDEPLYGEVEAEAREHVARLAAHPSLVLWTGCNENQWGYHDWGWQPILAGRPWGERYYHELLPGIVAELDPTRPYWPGSPYSGSQKIHPNDPSHGTVHIWDVWNTHDYTHYRAWTPRFVGEFGFQGPATQATLAAAITGPLDVSSPLLAAHEKHPIGFASIAASLSRHLPQTTTFTDWHYAAQVNQARAVTLGIEHFRSLRPYCSGTIIWQLNDCWPVISWSLVDSDGRRKPAWYATRRAYQDRLLTIQPRGGGLVLVADNDTDQPWQDTVTITRRGFDDRVLAEAHVRLQAGARDCSHTMLVGGLGTPGDPARELLVADSPGHRAWWFFAEDKDIPHPAPDYQASATPVDGGYQVTITAGVLLRDLAVFPDLLDPDATVDDMLITLLPGESTTFHVTSSRRLDPAALTTMPVLRCVNDLSTAPDGPAKPRIATQPAPEAAM